MPVYFVTGQTTRLIKIGKSADVCHRIADMQVGSPDTLIVLRVLTTESSDYFYHRKFLADWVRGEWFRPSNTLLDFIESLPKSAYDGWSTGQRYCPPTPFAKVDPETAVRPKVTMMDFLNRADANRVLTEVDPVNAANRAIEVASAFVAEQAACCAA
jgi:hypothetical protein